ncbi:MAG: LuxR C-terminal-related transcriptional regulator, partial [Anaerolineales bacterium]|nr:LuxR C-terminal-related transcriptional regulator [Anaerolineales bacterium]
NLVPRTHLIERLNEGLAAGCKLTLISAPAGFGKTTLVSEWVAGCGEPVAWLSLDVGDNDPARFISYLISALQTIKAGIGDGLLAALQSPQPLQIETILTTLLNEISILSEHFVLILDDYHLLDSQPVDGALTFIIEHQPPQMHLVIATREDPSLPLARLRARGQCAELRAADLRFTPVEAAEFLNRVMDLHLSDADIAALETRTEGWIAGLQMAAISMQGHQDTAGFIQSFTGSHRFVLDYLLEEVLQRQSVDVQAFLLHTSILDRMCGSLCDAVLLDPSTPGQATLEYLERTNLFIIPLDNERRWYRYHHLFSDLLRKRLGQSLSPEEIARLHIRASQWFEDDALEIEAFHHSAAANDIERTERLMEGKGIPLHLRGALNIVLAWLDSLPQPVLDARPMLRVRSATIALMAGQTTGVKEKIQAAEKALEKAVLDVQTRDLIGQLACARAILAVTRYQAEEIISQAQRALEYLAPENLRYRFTVGWVLAVAYHYQGNRTASMQVMTETLSIQAPVSKFAMMLAITHLGHLQELGNQLYQAAETYGRALQLLGDQPLPSAHDVHLGLARIYYEWNDLDKAQQHTQQSLQLAYQYDRMVDRHILSEVLLARLKLTVGDVDSAAALLDQAQHSANQMNFTRWMPEVIAARVLVLIQRGQLTAAAEVANQYGLSMSQARVLLSQGNPSEALALLAYGDQEKARETLNEALALAEPEGFIRLFLDEGPQMAELLSAAAAQGVRPGYVNKLLAAFETEPKPGQPSAPVADSSSLIDPLSPRELEVLGLIAQGLSNQEICKRLFLALDTVKGHNRRIFDKLQVQRRTEAIARARELGLL